jgi:CarD family transcriptional regulator
MSSVKKKNRKTKAVAARSAAKSRRVTAKRQTQPKGRKVRAGSMPRARQSAVKAGGKSSAKTKVRKAARLRTAALKRLKKMPSRARKPTSQTKGRAKAAPRLANLKQGARGKSRESAAQLKLSKSAAQPRQSAARSEATSQKLLSERRAHAAAVMALRATSGKPAPQTRGSASVSQKVQKKATPAESRSARPSAPLRTPSAPAPATSAAPPALEGRPRDIRFPERPGFRPAPRPTSSVKLGFKPAEFIVYPAHGVGQIIAIEEQEVAGFKLELFVISFAKDKMILKVPTPKTVSVGMRKLAGVEIVKQALNTLTGRARIKRTMWSRRAQEYEAKINSGDLVAIAEVVRDLYRSEAQPEQSYSERQLYEAALDRVARELAVVQKLTETESLKLIESQLQKGPRRTKAEEAEAAGGESEEGVEEAA